MYHEILVYLLQKLKEKLRENNVATNKLKRNLSLMFRIVLKTHVFQIPSDFPLFNNINHDIYLKLINYHQYKIKSNVCEEVVQSFIKYWINKQIPNIEIDNFIQFYFLSQEFDLMKDIIQIYMLKKSLQLPLFHKNQILSHVIDNKYQIFTVKQKNYHQVIDLLFNNSDFYSYSWFFEDRNEIYQACIRDDMKFIDLLSRKKVLYDGLLFCINEHEKTAAVFSNIAATGDVFIPYSVRFESEEYLVTSIIEYSFKASSSITSVQFPLNSELKLIEKCSFINSSIERIVIPSHVERIEESAFAFCYQLQHVEFQSKSELKYIGKQAFFYTSIESILIPSNVIKIEESSFFHCEKLNEIVFSSDSKLKTIEKKCFDCSSLEKIVIPSFVDDIKEGWCCGASNLTKIAVLPNNKRYSCINNTFIVGKSDPLSDSYDVLLFARRDIKIAKIPSFITKIAPYAFDQCTQLQVVDFPDDSQLELIDKFAFNKSSLEKITIPSKVVKIGEGAFFYCKCLQFVDFTKESELNIIDQEAFLSTSIEYIKVPSKVVKIGQRAFGFCRQLRRVEFDNNSNLLLIGFFAFSNCALEYICIPDRVIQINDNAFGYCRNLQILEFAENSNLHFLHKNPFVFSFPLICIPVQLRNLMEKK